MLIAATGDVHSPRFFDEYVKAVDSMIDKPDLFLITGDMVHRGEIDEYEKVYNTLFGKVNCPIVACFGNNEFSELREGIRQGFLHIRFLDDQSAILNVGGRSVGIFGTTGSLESPTPWQRRNIPNIESLYKQRMDLADRSLARMRTDFKILLMHYAPTYKTLDGENPRFFSTMGWNVYENVLIHQKPTLVLHSHSHHGKKQAWVDTVPVFNVSLPIWHQIVMIDTEKLKPGLTKFVD
jgi:Icc-related predicted phosphoesterase